MSLLLWVYQLAVAPANYETSLLQTSVLPACLLQHSNGTGRSFFSFYVEGGFHG